MKKQKCLLIFAASNFQTQMKKIITAALIALQFTAVFAQQAADTIPVPAKVSKFPKVKLYGILRVDFYYNSRQMEESSDGFALVLPKAEDIDANGKDLNAAQMTGFTATATRFGIDLEAFYLKALKTTVTGRIETDFQGFGSSVTMLRIRHAWINMAFKNSELLVGQYWHPLFEGVVPNVLDVNGGHPYQPFGRHPQVKFTYKPKNMQLFVAGAYQTQFLSTGVDANGNSSGRNLSFQKFALLPDLNAGIEYSKETWKIGLMGEYKQIVPRTVANVASTDDNGDPVIDTDGNPVINAVYVKEKVQSYAVAAYGQYSQKAVTLKAKAVYGQNLSDLSMIGGYAATAVNDKGEWTYKAFDVATAWLNADFNITKNWQISIYGGYTKNLGCNSQVLTNTSVYGSLLYAGQMIDQAWRASALLSYRILNWNAVLEYGYNRAYYGDFDISKGKAVNAGNGIGGSRLLAVLMYSF